MEQKTVTRNELWLEFKKSIDSGNFTKFKTRRGFDDFISRLVKNNPGKELCVYFLCGPNTLLKCTLKLKRESEVNK